MAAATRLSLLTREEVPGAAHLAVWVASFVQCLSKSSAGFFPWNFCLFL